MHKFFAKSFNPDKKIIFLPECHSTNDHLLKISKKDDIAEGTAVITDFQSKGKGQRGNSWISEPGANLLFSILLKPDFLPLDKQFSLTMIASLSVKSALEEIGVDSVRIKWPNDILVENRKICGILSESSIIGDRMEKVVIGIGLNVNQTEFGSVMATSIKREIGSEYNKEELLEKIVDFLWTYYQSLNEDHISIKQEYYQSMYWYNEEGYFESDGRKFYGKISGVDNRGQLVVQVKGIDRKYNLKEISFLL